MEEGVYKILFETVQEGLILVDDRGVICLSNPRAEEMFGYLDNELVSMPIEALVPKNIKSSHKGLRDGYIEKPAKRSMGQGMNLLGRRKDDSEFPVEISLNSFIGSNGKKYVVALVSDITKRKKIQSELNALDENYKVLFESINEGLILVNKKGVITLSNPRGLEMFGYTEEELIGQKIEKLIPQKLRGGHVAHRSGYHAHPSKRSMGGDMNLSAERKDGSVFPVEVSLNYFTNSEKEQVVVALVSDITERKIAQDELKKVNLSLEDKVESRTKQLWKSEQLYKSIARNFPSGVISIFDKELKYLFAEGQDLYKLGISTEDLVGQKYLARLEEGTANYVEGQLLSVFEGGSRSFEVSVGDQVYMINAVPLHDDDDDLNSKIDRILVVEKNITNQKIISKKLEANLLKEKELNDMKSRFVSMASHEFRTPLTTINSSATLIDRYLEKGDLEKPLKHTSRIKGSVRNLTSILNDFLSIEKLESGKVEVNLVESDVVVFLKDLAEEMNSICKKNQSVVVYGLESLVVNTDLQILRNVLTNLISNGIKYSDVGSIIEIHVNNSSKGYDIIVKDHGIGIPKPDQEKMFSRFFRAGNVTNIEGTGLGLNIVTRYLLLLEGEISFESEEGKGSSFKVSLPKK